MSELADWCACETLWLLRRGGREPRTLSVDALIARDVGRTIQNGARLFTKEPDVPVKWTRAVPDMRAAAVVTDDLASTLIGLFRERGEKATGYRSEDYLAHESMNLTSGPTPLTWWLLDVGSRPSSTAWLDCAAVAQKRGEKVDRLGVCRIVPGSIDRPGTVTLEDRPAGDVLYVLDDVRTRQSGVLASDPLRIPRTPGWHCARCPDMGCAVRVR